ncbi:hypothetical protein [Novosphingobium sp.]|nr:hypothetical protein [Novosphingobium sp.]
MIAKIQKVLADARAIDDTPLHVDFLLAANAAVWGTVLALLWGGLLS